MVSKVYGPKQIFGAIASQIAGALMMNVNFLLIRVVPEAVDWLPVARKEFVTILKNRQVSDSVARSRWGA